MARARDASEPVLKEPPSPTYSKAWSKPCPLETKDLWRGFVSFVPNLREMENKGLMAGARRGGRDATRHGGGGFSGFTAVDVSPMDAGG